MDLRMRAMEQVNGTVDAAVQKALRFVSYASVGLIGLLSLIPAALRPDTGASGKLEHLLAYMGAAALIGLAGSTLRQRLGGLWLLPYAGVLELAQIYVPGRHPRFSDFVVSGGGAILGVVAAFGVYPFLRHLLATVSIARGKRV